LFAAINCCITSCFGERLTPFFIAKNTLVFTLIVPGVFSFSATVFSFSFLPWFLFRSSLSLHQGIFWPLVHVGFHQKKVISKRFEWYWKEKKFHAKKWYKKELV
jgi:hypothetical protein